MGLARSVLFSKHWLQWPSRGWRGRSYVYDSSLATSWGSRPCQSLMKVSSFMFCSLSTVPRTGRVRGDTRTPSSDSTDPILVTVGSYIKDTITGSERDNLNSFRTGWARLRTGLYF